MGDRYDDKNPVGVSRDNNRSYSRNNNNPSDRNYPRNGRQNNRDQNRRRADSMEDNYYGRGDKRRYTEDGGYYGRRDSDGRSSKDGSYHGSSSKEDYYRSSPRDDYYDSKDYRGGSKDDYYGDYHGRGGYEKDSRRQRDGDSYEEEDWICVKCSCKNRPFEKRCFDCGKYKTRSPASSEDEFGRPKKKKEKTVSRQWPPLFEGNGDKFVLDSRSGMFYDSTSDFFYDPASKLYYGNKKKSYFSYNVATKKFVPVDSTDGDERPAAPRGSSGDADVADADQMMIMPHGADAVKKDVAVTPKIAINIKTAPKSDKKRKKRSESNADSAKKEKPPATGTTPPRKVPKKHAENMEKWQERQREMNPAAMPPVTNQGKPICWVCKRKFATEEKLKLHEAKSQLHKDNLEKQKQQEPKPVVESGVYVDRAKQRRDLYGPDLVVPTTVPEVTPLSEPVESGVMENPATNIGHQMMEKMGWKEGGTLGRGSEEQLQQQAALAKDWDRIEGLAAQNSNATIRRPR